MSRAASLPVWTTLPEQSDSEQGDADRDELDELAPSPQVGRIRNVAKKSARTKKPSLLAAMEASLRGGAPRTSRPSQPQTDPLQRDEHIGTSRNPYKSSQKGGGAMREQFRPPQLSGASGAPSQTAVVAMNTQAVASQPDPPRPRPKIAMKSASHRPPGMATNETTSGSDESNPSPARKPLAQTTASRRPPAAIIDQTSRAGTAKKTPQFQPRPAPTSASLFIPSPPNNRPREAALTTENKSSSEGSDSSDEFPPAGQFSQHLRSSQSSRGGAGGPQPHSLDKVPSSVAPASKRLNDAMSSTQPNRTPDKPNAASAFFASQPARPPPQRRKTMPSISREDVIEISSPEPEPRKLPPPAGNRHDPVVLSDDSDKVLTRVTARNAANSPPATVASAGGRAGAASVEQLIAARRESSGQAPAVITSTSVIARPISDPSSSEVRPTRRKKKARQTLPTAFNGWRRNGAGVIELDSSGDEPTAPPQKGRLPPEHAAGSGTRAGSDEDTNEVEDLISSSPIPPRTSPPLAEDGHGMAPARDSDAMDIAVDVTGNKGGNFGGASEIGRSLSHISPSPPNAKPHANVEHVDGHDSDFDMVPELGGSDDGMEVDDTPASSAIVACPRALATTSGVHPVLPDYPVSAIHYPLPVRRASPADTTNAVEGHTSGTSNVTKAIVNKSGGITEPSPAISPRLPSSGSTTVVGPLVQLDVEINHDNYTGPEKQASPSSPKGPEARELGSQVASHLAVPSVTMSPVSQPAASTEGLPSRSIPRHPPETQTLPTTPSRLEQLMRRNDPRIPAPIPTTHSPAPQAAITVRPIVPGRIDSSAPGTPYGRAAAGKRTLYAGPTGFFKGIQSLGSKPRPAMPSAQSAVVIASRSNHLSQFSRPPQELTDPLETHLNAAPTNRHNLASPASATASRSSESDRILHPATASTSNVIMEKPTTALGQSHTVSNKTISQDMHQPAQDAGVLEPWMDPDVEMDISSRSSPGDEHALVRASSPPPLTPATTPSSSHASTTVDALPGEPFRPLTSWPETIRRQIARKSAPGLKRPILKSKPSRTHRTCSSLVAAMNAANLSNARTLLPFPSRTGAGSSASRRSFVDLTVDTEDEDESARRSAHMLRAIIPALSSSTQRTDREGNQAIQQPKPKMPGLDDIRRLHANLSGRNTSQSASQQARSLGSPIPSTPSPLSVLDDQNPAPVSSTYDSPFALMEQVIVSPREGSPSTVHVPVPLRNPNVTFDESMSSSGPTADAKVGSSSNRAGLAVAPAQKRSRSSSSFAISDSSSVRPREAKRKRRSQLSMEFDPPTSLSIEARMKESIEDLTRSSRSGTQSASSDQPRSRSRSRADQSDGTSAGWDPMNVIDTPGGSSDDAVIRIPRVASLGSDGLADGVRQIDISPEDWRRPHVVLGKEFGPVHVLAENLPHMLEDLINALPEWRRKTRVIRLAFESAIIESTAEDEPHAPRIHVRNDIDDEMTPPWEFHYSNSMWHGRGVPPPDMDNLEGCGCIGACDPKSKTCSCVNRQEASCILDDEDGPHNNGFLYNDKGRLKIFGYPIFECNDKCQCTDDCKNRVVQFGRKCEVDILKTPTKGWGIFARKRIARGTFIGVYAGELLEEEEGEMRGQYDDSLPISDIGPNEKRFIRIYNEFGRTYLFDIDFWHIHQWVQGNQHTNKFVVDAYHAGNFTRFLNHSCDPNCLINACYINEATIEKPLVTLFAARDIDAGEELTFSYFGDPSDNDGDNEGDGHDAIPVRSNPSKSKEQADLVYRRCECGAPNCTGKLFN